MSNSYMAFSELLNKTTFTDWQTFDLLDCLFHGKKIISYSTGLGKTYLMAGLIRAYKNQMSSRRFLVFIDNNQIDQTSNDIRKLTGLSVLAVTGQMNDVMHNMVKNDFTKYDVLMITYSFLDNIDLVRFLYPYLHKYYGLFADEAHTNANFLTSKRAGYLRAIFRNFKVKFSLTATPATNDVRQIANLIHIIDPENLPDVKDFVNDMNKGTAVSSIFPDLILNRDRASLGITSKYIPDLRMLEPHEWQTKVRGSSPTAAIKGEGAHNVREDVIKILRSKQGQKGLIYIRNHAIREWVLPAIEETGLRVGMIHGKVSREEKTRIQDEFNMGNLDLVITSVTVGLNLDSNFIIFLNFTADLAQMLGRAERGLNPKILHLHFIFVRETVEIPHFLNGMYQQSILLQEVLEKDYSLIISAGREIMRKLREENNHEY